ncbi:MAG: glycosyl transferase [Deltaproteobacteria bacterium RIFCSPLOWO2_02_FULL_53_8]|nr:MAG: glycosyl transferase [Deltaproteobacteria bacterium RIFCSPLOWO2_02_FULL_53_8]
MAKILIYGINFFPEPTGTGKYSGELAAWLAGRGHVVDVITAPPHYPEWKIHKGYSNRFSHQLSEGVCIFRCPLIVPDPKRIGSKSRILLETSFAVTSFFRWIPIWCRAKRYEVVIAVCPPLQVGVFPWLLGKLWGTPWVFHFQDLQVDAALQLGMLSDSWFIRMLFRVEAALLNRADRVSTISLAMSNRIHGKGVPKERIWHFPNWSNLGQVRPGPRMNSFRTTFGYQEDKVLVLYAGSMGEKQGLDLMLEAAKRLAHRTDLRFLLVGEGAAKAKLQTKAASEGHKNIDFLPIQPPELLSEMLAAADIHLVIQKRAAADLVMPSKLVNILAAGKAPIVTAEMGTELFRVINDHNLGMTVPPEQPQDLENAIIRMVDDRETRKFFERNAREYAENQLNRNFILESFEAKLLGLINSSLLDHDSKLENENSHV